MQRVRKKKKDIVSLLQGSHTSASYQEQLTGLSRVRDGFIDMLLLPLPCSDLGQVIYLVGAPVFPSAEWGN